MSRSTISTFQLFEMYPDQESARLYLESRLWPVRCPVCRGGGRITTRKAGYYQGPQDQGKERNVGREKVDGEPLPATIAPRMKGGDIYERICAELIQVGNRHPGARRDLGDIEKLVRRAAHAKDDLDEAKLLEAKRAGWDKGYSAGLDKVPGDRQRFSRP